MSRSSSSNAFSYVVFDTCLIVSNPTTSAVRKVALLGRPEIGPVNLSTSSIVRPCLIARFMVAIIPYTPILFPIKLGVSFA